jgi:quercetin dioxygenase-like cupin family protein
MPLANSGPAASFFYRVTSVIETEVEMPESRVVRAGEGEAYGPGLIFKHGSKTGAPFDFLIVDVPYLTGPPLHVHEIQHDTFYVLEGVLTVQMDEEIIELSPGDFASVPPGVPHTFDNTRKNQAPVKVCNVMTPGGLDAFIGAANEASAWQDPAKLAAIGAKHGATFVGPPLAAKLGLGK